MVDSCQKKDRVINLGILPKLKKGDWVLVLNNFAVQKISVTYAKQLQEFLNKKEV